MIRLVREKSIITLHQKAIFSSIPSSYHCLFQSCQLKTFLSWAATYHDFSLLPWNCIAHMKCQVAQLQETKVREVKNYR